MKALFASTLLFVLATSCSNEEVGDHDHSDYAAVGHDHDTDYAAATHNHDTDYAAAAHTHDDLLSRTAFTGIDNDANCDDDTGYLVIGVVQPEFGCHPNCEEVCTRHNMTCEHARAHDGTLRTCTSVGNNAVLYCWCKPVDS